ncbi:MoeA, N-terminal and linker domain-containing protein [Aspergillus egyptiacus]|nr:MoeA, N-terminal and linker domain-containing protein [Aspergillus egyptiacus]
MGLPYADAVQRVQNEARCQRASFLSRTEPCSIYDACNRIVPEAVYSPISTPEYDTSAMDGFALSSAASQTASPESPVRFEVQGITTAGDEPHSDLHDRRSALPPCVEIMTGAPFPRGPEAERFDCCVPVEEVVESEDKLSNRRCISIAKPARRHQHRRFAGGDFGKRDLILEPGERIAPRHVMAMASVGLMEVAVLRKPRIAVFSTGCELLSRDAMGRRHPYMIPDANGPYLTTVLRKWGVDADFCGVGRDHAETMHQAIATTLARKQYDGILTSGAVSAGRCDMIPDVVHGLGGRPVFHKVAVKPGHPVLFSMLPAANHREIAFFGLPGNPVAAAACLRFLVRPYLQTLQLQELEPPHVARLQMSTNGDADGQKPSNGTSTTASMTFREEPDIFRPAILSPSKQQVRIIDDHSPGKTKPFLHANCWVHIPRGVSELCEDEMVNVYPCE